MHRPLHPAAGDLEVAPDSAPADPSERALVAGVLAGHEREAERLHDRLRPRIERTVAALLGVGDPDRDDLVQQSFIELVLSLPRYRGECALETWAATIAARTVWKAIRRRQRERRVFAGEELDPDSSSPASLKRDVIVRDLAQRIRRHFEAMDPAKAEACFLHDVCGFDAREVAKSAGISESAAHARIARGRRDLHERLAADPDLAAALEDVEGNS